MILFYKQNKRNLKGNTTSMAKVVASLPILAKEGSLDYNKLMK
jgi:hypothetical protein